ncbi:DegT/DnrJ/EryC1/StrS family aminotransferase [Wenjunlia tyrosinilytica]|uniref:dTDP-4-dehydro-6-deoxyglucose aminotransferase n=1 Tax=Wenjunlia tyrosinilytica TaxID=1544741 RepID=A0A917ZVR3_9ACTN|nr:DegT/DnrJ/EryC1/StrS family aminotransferase [Wenjunlia tyrosinilytica]GGO96208.1 dTDP-4-dehydro-6-deoxyglucose aminotransferase [Wenjunlia tyrosinilytica]
MTTTATALPAALGGTPAFPDGLPLTVVRIPRREEVLGRIDAILADGRLTNGRTVAALEEEAAGLLDVPHVVAVSNCTSGLMLVLQALEVTGPVVMPGFTFSATAHAAVWAGSSPVFAECSADSLTLDPDHAAHTLRNVGGTAVMATHVYGTPCRVERLQQAADRSGVPLVYDAAHALGSRRAGVPVGGFGAAEVFSMSPTKVAPAGEGGLIATRNEALARTLRTARDYGNPGDYDCLFAGLNARMSELHAAVGLASLSGLTERVAHRGELAAVFAEEVKGLPGLRFPVVDEGDTSTFKDLTLVIDREEFGLDVPSLATALGAEGIDTRRYFHPPVHRQKAYRALGQADRLPLTDALSAAVLTVPLWSHMTAGTMRRTAAAVARIQDHADEVRAALLGGAHGPHQDVRPAVE